MNRPTGPPVARAEAAALPQPPAALAAAPRLAALRYPAYRFYWVGQLATNIGTWMQIVATGWLVLELTDSPASLGLNAAFQAGPLIVFALVGGVVADRFDRYRLMVGAQVAQLVLDVALAGLVATGHVTVPQIFVYSLFGAIVNGLTTPARQAFLPQLLPREALASGVALNSMVWQGSAVVGPTIAGLVLAAWGTAWNFHLNVVSDLVNLGAMLLIRVPAQPRRTARSSPWTSLGQGAEYVAHNADVRTLLLACATLTLLSRPYTQLMPVFARDVFQVGPQGLGIMLAMPSIGAVAAVAGIGVIGSQDTARWFLRTTVLSALALIAFAAASVYELSLGLLVLAGAAIAAASTLGNTLLLRLVEDRMRGRVMGYYVVATWGSWRLGALPAGLVAEVWSTPLAVGLAAAILLGLQFAVAGSHLIRAGGPARPVVEPGSDEQEGG
jgi:MFS family permease